MPITLDPQLLGLVAPLFKDPLHRVPIERVEKVLADNKIGTGQQFQFLQALRCSALSGQCDWQNGTLRYFAPATPVPTAMPVHQLAERLMDNPALAGLFAALETPGAQWAAAQAMAVHALESGALLMAAPQTPVEASGPSINTPYVNTISVDDTPTYPGDLDLEKRITNYVRWIAANIVDHANRNHKGVGGHIATYQSAAVLYEVGFEHFFKPEDSIYFQGHASPGMYARAFMEGRLSKDQLLHFRREVEGKGLSSYPHAWLMPDFWQMATVSMGLGPISAIYQARFNRYLQNRGIKDTSTSKIWAFLGDGEMDEVESRGAAHIAARDKLDNLIFVVNCNLQRLDSPVRANGSIIQELEGSFAGAGWNVIKVIWGSSWDKYFDQDQDGALQKRISEIPDGQWQNYAAWETAQVREDFVGDNPALQKMFSDLSDDEFRALMDDRGGHDPVKVHAAYQRAVESTGRPTIILTQSIKGRNLKVGQGALGAHNRKNLDDPEVHHLAETLGIPLQVPDTHEGLAEWDPFYTLDDAALDYARERREALGGAVPQRRPQGEALTLPAEDYLLKTVQAGTAGPDCQDAKTFVERLLYAIENKKLPEGVRGRPFSTTMVMVNLLKEWLKHETVGRHIVPIVPDEARTFGMDELFQKPGVWDPHGQNYDDRNPKSMTNYRSSPQGQILEEGITEAGSMASYIAAGTSYSTHGVPMIPMYFFYSMFGPQRTLDQIWQAADMRTRGFMFACTFGRTTLNGEGLQHEDGHSLLLTSVVPNLVSYEPAFGYELAVIAQDGLRRMYGDNPEDISYYVTLHNENYLHAPLPSGRADEIKNGILKGGYLFARAEEVYPDLPANAPRVRLLGSGTMMQSVLQAQKMLADRGIAADVYSITSYTELRREAMEVERWNTLHPEEPKRVSYLEELFGHATPMVAVSDSMKMVPEQIQRWVPLLSALGTDGFGRSDTREQLRDWFEVSAKYVVYQALHDLGVEDPAKARDELGINPDKPSAATHDVLRNPSGGSEHSVDLPFVAESGSGDGLQTTAHFGGRGMAVVAHGVRPSLQRHELLGARRAPSFAGRALNSSIKFGPPLQKHSVLFPFAGSSILVRGGIAPFARAPRGIFR